MNKATNHYRLQIFALIAGYAAWGVFWGAWGALLPAIKITTHATDAQLGGALLFVAVGALPALMFIGPLIDRFGPAALFISMILFALSISLLSFAHSIFSLSVILLILGATSGALDVSLNSGAANLEAITKRKLFNLLTAAFPIAVVFASPLAGYSRELHLSLTTLFIIIAMIVAFASLLNYNIHQKTWVAKKSTASNLFIPKISLTKILLLLGLVAIGIHMIEVAVEQWSAIYIEHSLNGSPAIAGFGPAVYMGMLFLGRMASQLYANKLSDKQMLVLTGLSAAAGLAISHCATSPLIALIGFAIAGFGMATGIPTLFSITGRTVKEEDRGKAISAVTAIAYLGYLISPPFVGGLAHFISLRNSWLVLSGLAFLTVLCFLAYSIKDYFGSMSN